MAERRAKWAEFLQNVARCVVENTLFFFFLDFHTNYISDRIKKKNPYIYISIYPSCGFCKWMMKFIWGKMGRHCRVSVYFLPSWGKYKLSFSVTGCEPASSRAAVTILGKISEQRQQQMNGPPSTTLTLRVSIKKRLYCLYDFCCFSFFRHVSPIFLEKGSGRPVPLTSAWAASSTHSDWSHDCLAAGGYSSAVYQFNSLGCRRVAA